MYKKLLCLTILVLFSGMVSHSEGAVIFFEELFDDDNFSARGWYDGTILRTTAEHIPGSISSAEFHFLQGATKPTNGGGVRKLFTESESVYISFYIKYSSNWTGSNQYYGMHEFHTLTNLNGAYSGLAYTHLTTYIEQNAGEPLLGIQDGENIDESNIGVDLTNITEERSIAGCNGDSDGYGNGSCYLSGSVHWNGKRWEAGDVYFQDTPGPYYKNDWHFIEVFFKLNSIVNGKAVADGHLKYWYDGEPLIAHEDVMLRTGEHPTMKFNQYIAAPYMGEGSPIDQTFWVDNLTVADSRPIRGDTDNDGDVDFEDYTAFASAWLSEAGESNWSLNYEISQPPNGTIDGLDLDALAENWLVETPVYLLDNFELYTGTTAGNNPLTDTWEGTGATEDYYDLETFHIHTGDKSLRLWYDNSYSPYYCGVSRTQAPQDWTLGGTAEGLSFWYRGSPNIDEMYVRLTDSSDRETIVKYSDAWDTGDLLAEQWQKWSIALQRFIDNNDVFDMTAVKTVEIGVGDPVSPEIGVVGGGQLYLDDVWLYNQ